MGAHYRRKAGELQPAQQQLFITLQIEKRRISAGIAGVQAEAAHPEAESSRDDRRKAIVFRPVDALVPGPDQG